MSAGMPLPRYIYSHGFLTKVTRRGGRRRRGQGGGSERVRKIRGKEEEEGERTEEEVEARTKRRGDEGMGEEKLSVSQDGLKMGKSLGNVLEPTELVEKVTSKEEGEGGQERKEGRRGERKEGERRSRRRGAEMMKKRQVCD
eukprot:11631-Hanusia_phi.AAC.1